MATNRPQHGADPRYCADCGTLYDHLRLRDCPRCPELTWLVWDWCEYECAAPDPARGILESFASKTAAEAALPRIQASMAEIGEDMALADFVIAPACP
jgi:hypothetical protein